MGSASSIISDRLSEDECRALAGKHFDEALFSTLSSRSDDRSISREAWIEHRNRFVFFSFVPKLVLKQLIPNLSEGSPQDHVIGDAALPTKPFSFYQDTACMLADISGFTKLTERFAAKGAEGADELTTVINAFYSEMIETITKYSGDVNKFAGDAMLVFFVPENEDGYWDAQGLCEALHRAAQCALEMTKQVKAACWKEAVRDRLPEKAVDDITLGMHSAIAGGAVETLHLGGERGRWDIVSSGRPLCDLGPAANASQVGQCVVADGVWKYMQGEPCCAVGSRLEFLTKTGETAAGWLLERVAETSKGGLSNELTPTDGTSSKPNHPYSFLELLNQPRCGAIVKEIKRYIPGAVPQESDSVSLNRLNELRIVSTLFLSFPELHRQIAGLPMAGGDSCLTYMEHVMKVVQRSLYEFEGSLNKMLVDDKGVVIICAFGLPPFSHEDDAFRACRFALLLQEKLAAVGKRTADTVVESKTGAALANDGEELDTRTRIPRRKSYFEKNGLPMLSLPADGVRVGIGITTGSCFCGIVGSEVRCEYTLMGDPINLSARLMQHSLAHTKKRALPGVAETHVSPLGILCDEATFDEVDSQRSNAKMVEMIELEPLRVKGKELAVRCFQPRRRVGALMVNANQQEQLRNAIKGQRDPPFVGRRKLVVSIRERLQQLQAESKGGIIVIEGDKGSGKTRLMRHTCSLVSKVNQDWMIKSGATGFDAEKFVTYYIGVAGETERNVPYYVWRTIFLAMAKSASRQRRPSAVSRDTSNGDIRKSSSFRNFLGDDRAGDSGDQQVSLTPDQVHVINMRRFLSTLDASEIGEGPNYWTEYLPLLMSVLNISVDDTPSTSNLTGETRGKATTKMLSNVIRARARKSPILILVDNVQWVDSASAFLLKEVAKPKGSQAGGILTIVACRPTRSVISRSTSKSAGQLSDCDGAEDVTSSFIEDLRETDARSLEGDGHNDPDVVDQYKQPEWIELEPMGDDEMTKLLCGSLDVSTIPQEALNIILEKAKGNPYFGCSLLRLFTDSGHLRVDDVFESDCDEEDSDAVIERICVVNEDMNLRDAPLPDSVQKMVITKIDQQLDADTKTLLKVAAVVGARFTISVLSRVFTEDLNDKLMPSLTVLVKNDFVNKLVVTSTKHQKVENGARQKRSQEERAGGLSDIFHFRDPIIREVAYYLTPATDRRQMHAQIGTQLEDDHQNRRQMHAQIGEQLEDGSQNDTGPQILANHFLKGSVFGKAMVYCFDAATRACDYGQFSDADYFCGHLKSLLMEHSDELDKLLKSHFNNNEEELTLWKTDKVGALINKVRDHFEIAKVAQDDNGERRNSVDNLGIATPTTVTRDIAVERDR